MKIVQVQESGVNDSYNLEPVDIENIDLDLSADYDLLQQLVASASSQKLDLSTLIINQLRSYPDQVKRLEDAKNELSVANQKVTDQEKAILDLQNEKQELEQEISQKQDETKKTEETVTQDSSSGQTQASPAANEKVSDTQGSSNEVIKPTE